MSFEQTIISEFVSESKEHIQTLEDIFLKIEDCPQEELSGYIDRLFRSVHSIKGTSGFLGFSNISEISHSMETMLQMMRDKKIEPKGIYIDALFKGSDLLGTLLGDVDKSNQVDITEMQKTLSDLINGVIPADNEGEAQALVAVKDGDGRVVHMELHESQLDELPDFHQYLYLLKFDLFQTSQSEGSISQSRELLDLGAILSSKVEIAPNALTCYMIYSTMTTSEELQSIINLSTENITELDRDEISRQLKKKKGLPPATSSSSGEAIPSEAKESKSLSGKSQGRSETVRIAVDLLDKLMTLAGELVLVRNQQLMGTNQTDPSSRAIAQRLDHVTTELQENIMRTRMQPVGSLFGKLPRVVRDLSKKLGKKIEITTIGDDVELDKTILESLADPFIHLIRNCCDHGIEYPDEREQVGKSTLGTIQVHAWHEAGQINIKVEDDGKGIDPEVIKQKALEKGLRAEEELARMSEKDILNLIMLPGFSTAKTVSDISGRGVGMDVLKDAVEKLAGLIELESKFGKGTTIHLRLPLTLAIIPCLIVISGGNRYAIPQVNLEELVRIYDEEVYTKLETVGDLEVYRLRDNLLPMVRLNEILERPDELTERDRSTITEKYRKVGKDVLKVEKLIHNISLSFAVLRAGMGRYGLIVDEILGTEEIVVKPMHSKLNALNIYSGSTIMGDGKVAMILDAEGIGRHFGIDMAVTNGENVDQKAERYVEDEFQTVLLFKVGWQEQFAISLPLLRRIERVSPDRVEKVGKREFVTINGVSTLLLRLDEMLDVSSVEDKNADFYMLIPKYIKRPVGIFVSKLVDITATAVNLNVDSHMEDGLLGTAIVRELMTLFIDIYRLVDRVDPEMERERRAELPEFDSKKRILLVEDTIFFQRLIKGYLESDHYEVVTANNGEEGLQRFREQKFDMIVSDIEMPVMDGFDFIKAVRKEGSYHDFPVLALTALNAPNVKERILEAGFSAYESKIDREHLLHLVAKLLQTNVSHS